MDQLDAMRVFVAVADQAGFAAAARRLRMSPPAVTRAIAALEDHLGVRLLHRTTRAVRTTDAGARFLADSKRILAELAEAESTAASAHAEPRGPLAVTASVMFGRMFVAPLLFDFVARHPQVQLRALLVDRVVDLATEDVDVAIRIAPLDPRSYDIAIPVGAVRRVVCASPAFLAAHGTPRTPADLARLPAIAFSPTAAPIAPAALVVNSTDVTLAAALAGLGVTTALSYQVADEVRRGTLRILLPDHEPPPIPIHVIHREGRHASARVRAFVDLAVARLRADPAVNPAIRSGARAGRSRGRRSRSRRS